MALDNDNPLIPSNTLLVKLGSLIIHYEEFMSTNGHVFDRITVESLQNDPEVIKWKDQMNSLGLLPQKR